MAGFQFFNPNPNGAASGKNFPLTAAATDLNLGDQLTQQVQDQVDARKRKLAALSNTAGGDNPLSSTLGPAAMMLIGGQR